MWAKIWNAIRSVIARMTGAKNIEEALHILPVMSNKMEEAIKQWDKMYRNEADWLHEPTTGDPIKIISLGLPAFIAGEKARTATIEMKTMVTNPGTPPSSADDHVTEDTVPTDRASYLNKQYQLHLLPHIRKELEYGIAKGGLIIKPYRYNEDEIRFTFCQADEFYPISFDATGKMTEAAFTEKIVSKNMCYTRLEYHKLDSANKTVTVINKAYKSLYQDGYTDNNSLGTEIPLHDVVAWADVEPETVIKSVDRLLFAYFRMPEANTIDPNSPLGVSGFSRAVPLIKEADLQFSRMSWEYEGGQLAVDVDPGALRTTEIHRTEYIDGEAIQKTDLIEVPNILQKRLFRRVDLNSEETYQVFAPNLRDANYMNGLNNILQRIEDVTGISRGTLSDITRSEAKTATEMLILKQRSYATNRDIQLALQDALDDTVYVMNVFATLYNLAPEGNYVTTYKWDDSLINSPEEELQRRLTLVNAGIESKVALRMWYFNETEEQAIQELQKVQQEALQNAEMQAIASGMLQQNQPQDDGKNEGQRSSTETPPKGPQTSGRTSPKNNQQINQNKNKKPV